MKNIKNIVLIFISIILLVFFTVDIFAYNSFSNLEKNIDLNSNNIKIKKLQRAFKDFGLYNGNIDGNFKSIESFLLDYQKKSGIIKKDSDWGAGYFGVKTLNALKKDFKNSFNDITNKYLKLDEPALGERFFYVTAYYSPIKNQERYSYSSRLGRYRTYKEEIRLQGEGKRGASGKEVFYGMLAAPKNYRFGTKIELEGIGVGSVQDRGQAIVNSGERGYNGDRIDVWMGYGVEGLMRALKWGKRKVKGKIVGYNTELSIKFNDSPLAKYSKLYITPDSKLIEVRKLQTLLKDLDIYNGKIDGKYNSVKNVLINFQIKNNIISSKKSDEAGYFGKKTIAVLRKKYSGNIFVKSEKYDNYSLSGADIDNLKNIKKQLSKYIIKKANGNNYKINIYRNNLISKLDKLAKKTNHRKKQAQFLYLKSII